MKTLSNSQYGATQQKAKESSKISVIKAGYSKNDHE